MIGLIEPERPTTTSRQMDATTAWHAAHQLIPSLTARGLLRHRIGREKYYKCRVGANSQPTHKKLATAGAE